MAVGLGEGTPKALRVHLEHLEKNPPSTDFDISARINELMLVLATDDIVE